MVYVYIAVGPRLALMLHAMCEARLTETLFPPSSSQLVDRVNGSGLPWAHCPGRAPPSPAAAPAPPGAHYRGRARRPASEVIYNKGLPRTGNAMQCSDGTCQYGMQWRWCCVLRVASSEQRGRRARC